MSSNSSLCVSHSCPVNYLYVYLSVLLLSIHHPSANKKSAQSLAHSKCSTDVPMMSLMMSMMTMIIIMMSLMMMISLYLFELWVLVS